MFDVTGVRGAGKSALTRHVLAQIKGKYFTLESTAPVRHDQEMGFFIALCRRVCQQVLDDLEEKQVFHRKRDLGKEKARGKSRHLLLGVLVLVAVVSLGFVWQEDVLRRDSSMGSSMSRSDRSTLFDVVSDPLLGTDAAYKFLPLEAERRVMDGLITQIGRLVAEEKNRSEGEGGKASKSQQKWLLVPSNLPQNRAFWLVARGSRRQLAEGSACLP